MTTGAPEPEQTTRTGATAEAARAAFRHVDVWVFDLDNTLYPPSCRLFDQMNRKMTDFIMAYLAVDEAEATRLRGEYWRDHGTTLGGLMARHAMAPEAFIDFVHDIDLAVVAPAPDLAEAIGALPGRKVVHTNGCRAYAGRVLAQRGLTHSFDAVYGIAESAFTPKPERVAYDRIVAADGFDPRRAAMFEDTARNLIAPHQMGMRTVWAVTDSPRAAETADGEHVHFSTEDLTAFLGALVD